MEPKTELQRNAVAEVRRKELEVYQRALDIQWLNNRMEDGRMGRCLALIQREADMEKDFQERTDHAAIVNARAEKEAALAFEVAKVRKEETRELLRRHYLRERDPSLKELAKKLQAGYVCRDLKQQMLHNEYKRLQEKSEDDHANSILRYALYNDKEAKEHEEQLKMEQTMKYCKEIQQQLVNRQMQKQCQYEDTLIEKKMLDEVMRTISDEDKRELQQKREQTQKIHGEMVTTQQARAAWQAKQKQACILEERQIEVQRKMVSDRNSAIVAERERKVREKEEINEKITAKILADEAERREREDIITLLQEQEYLEKNVQDDYSEREKLERAKRDTKEALTAQMESRRRLAREQKEKEAEFRKETEAKAAADDEREREKARKLKEKGRLYSQQLLQQAADDARRRAARRAGEQARAQHVRDCDAAWRAEVSKEREKMVEEHVPNLIGFLQAGVVRQQDLPAVRAGVSTRQTGIDIDAMMHSTRRQKRFSKCNAQCRVLREF